MKIGRTDQQRETGTSVLQSAGGIGEKGTVKNESGELSTADVVEHKLDG